MTDSPSKHGLSHLDEQGAARMVDVGDKPETARFAAAEGFVRLAPVVLAAIRDNAIAKGPVLQTARLAGILAAKRTDELIPLCHTLPLDRLDIHFTLTDSGVQMRAEAATTARTGVEIETLVALSIAGTTIIDMTKSLDRTGCLESIRVVEKSGGRSGRWTHPSQRAQP
ncbi:MAG: cyclic pyranopterin phosphate synthase [Phycisphaerales bacterium]